MTNWPVKIDEMLAAMSRAAHIAHESNADLPPSYRREIDLIHKIRSELLAALPSGQREPGSPVEVIERGPVRVRSVTPKKP